jgi:hypothetical protein
VREVLAIYVLYRTAGPELVDPDFYHTIPDLEAETREGPEDMVYSHSLSPDLKRGRGITAIKAVYRAGK